MLLFRVVFMQRKILFKKCLLKKILFDYNIMQFIAE